MKRFVPLLLLVAALGGCATSGGNAPSAVRLPEAPPPGEPMGTTGLREAQVRAVYGAPAFVRKDGNGQIWRFDGPNCKAFFFFYSRESVTAVWHVETVPRGQAIGADENCLNALRAKIAPPRPTS